MPLADIDPRSQIIGEFFECLFARRLANNGPWTRGTSREKDILYTGEDRKTVDLDFEIKTSGQASGRIYGNRSYVQQNEDGEVDSASRKKRSGYYLCLNFWHQDIYQVRVGWIDPEDWEPQKAETGQAAGLKDYVYQFKLIPVPGKYYLDAPLFVLDGVGDVTVEALKACDISTIGDLVAVTARNAPGESNLKGVKRSLTEIGVGRSDAGRVARAVSESSYYRIAVDLAD